MLLYDIGQVLIFLTLGQIHMTGASTNHKKIIIYLAPFRAYLSFLGHAGQFLGFKIIFGCAHICYQL